MKVVLLCWGSLGDTLPFLRLARVMKSRGHDVAMAGNGSFARLGDRFDVALAELSSAEDYEALLKQPVRRIYSLGPRLAKTTYAFIEQHHVPGETVLVAPTFLFGARLAQERLQAPLATVHLAPLIARVGVPDLRSRLISASLFRLVSLGRLFFTGNFNRQSFSSFSPATSQNFTTALGRHASPESVIVQFFTIRRLKCSFHSLKILKLAQQYKR